MRYALFCCALFVMAAPCLPSQVAPSLAEVTTTEGVTYRGITSIREEPDGLNITHEGGIAKVPFTQLSAEMQQAYGYDPKQADEHVRRTREEQAEITTLLQQNAQAGWAREARQELAATSEHEFKRLRRVLAEKARPHRWKVKSVLEDGVIATCVEEGWLVRPDSRQVAFLAEIRQQGGMRWCKAPVGDLFIPMDTRGVADGDTQTGLLLLGGTFQYTDAGGDLRTIRQGYLCVDELLMQALYAGG